MPKLYNIRTKAMKEYRLENPQWIEAIAPFDFENARVDVDKDTEIAVLEACKEIGVRDGNKTAFDDSDITDLKCKVATLEMVMANNADEIKKGFGAAAKVIRSLEGRVLELEKDLKDRDDRARTLESRLQDLENRTKTLGDRPVVSQTESLRGVIPPEFADIDPSMFFEVAK
jgi:hypothetical protein